MAPLNGNASETVKEISMSSSNQNTRQLSDWDKYRATPKGIKIEKRRWLGRALVGMGLLGLLAFCAVPVVTGIAAAGVTLPVATLAAGFISFCAGAYRLRQCGDADEMGYLTYSTRQKTQMEKAAPPQQKTGARMKDGTIFAGISPDTGLPMYTTPDDAPLAGLGGAGTYAQAQDVAKKLDAHGHRDWRVPSKAELSVLFNSRAKIGNFIQGGAYPTGWYWSSTEKSETLVQVKQFNGGPEDLNLKDCQARLRCVRG